MKTARFIFTFIGFGVFSLGLAFAGESSGQSHKSAPRENQKAGDHSVDRPPGNQAHGKAVPMDGKPSKPNGPGTISQKIGQAGPINPGPRRTLATGLPQPESSRVATVPKNGLTMNQPENRNEQLAKPPSGRAVTASTPGVVRGRGANTASIGGLAASSARNSPRALDGATVKRKF